MKSKVSSLDAQNQKVKPKFEKLISAAINAFGEKQYKKGLKDCKAVLKVYPKNAEATAITGIIKHQTDHKEEGLKKLKDALRLNMKSFICWVLYAKANRFDYNLETATKSYLTASRIDPEKIVVLRELAVIQLQQEKVDQSLETFSKLLSKQCGYKDNWIALIIVTYLGGHLKQAFSLLNTYLETIDEKKEREVNLNELVFLGEKIQRETESSYNAFKFLKKNRHLIVDTQNFHQIEGECSLRNNNLRETEQTALQMIKEDHEDFDAHLLLCKSKGFDIERVEQKEINPDLIEIYKRLLSENPKSFLIISILLLLLEGRDFEQFFSDFIDKLPSHKFNVFEIIKQCLLSDGNKSEFVKNVFLERFSKDVEKIKNLNSVENQNFVVQSAFFVSSMAEFEGNFEEAIETLETVNNLVPNNYKVLFKLGCVLKKYGFFEKAIQILSKANENSPHMNRSSATELSKAKMALHYRKDSTELITSYIQENDKNVKSLVRLQYIEYFEKLAKSFFYKRQYKEALQASSAVIKYAEDAIKDVLDFHIYCFHKPRPRKYIEMMKFVWGKRKFKKFKTSALIAFNSRMELLEENNNPKNKEENINEAAKLIRNLVFLEPNNVTYLRSMALIHILKKKFFIVVKCLKKAMDMGEKKWLLWLPILKFNAVIDDEIQKMNSPDLHYKREILEEFKSRYMNEKSALFIESCFEKAKFKEELFEAIMCHFYYFQNKKAIPCDLFKHRTMEEYYGTDGNDMNAKGFDSTFSKRKIIKKNSIMRNQILWHYKKYEMKPDEDVMKFFKPSHFDDRFDSISNISEKSENSKNLEIKENGYKRD